jgi:hypothetical protein
VSDLVVVAIISGVFTTVGNGLAYLGLRQRVDKQGQEVGSKLQEAATKVEETRVVNETQIAVSNNFNQKLDKIHQGQNHLIRELNQVKRHVDTLSKHTGIPLDN